VRPQDRHMLGQPRGRPDQRTPTLTNIAFDLDSRRGGHAGSNAWIKLNDPNSRHPELRLRRLSCLGL
jgi:hypothetical protein